MFRWRGWYALLPFFIATTLLLIWRWAMLGGIGGYRNAGGAPQALSVGVVPILKTLALRLWAVLFFPINWSIEPGLIFSLVTILYLVAIVRLSFVSIPRRFFILAAGWLLAMALPPLQQLLIGADLQKSRYLYLPAAAFCLLLGGAVARLDSKQRYAAAVAIVGFNLFALFHNLAAWEDASKAARSACTAAAACGKKIGVSGVPGSLKGVYLFANGLQACVECSAANLWRSIFRRRARMRRNTPASCNGIRKKAGYD